MSFDAEDIREEYEATIGAPVRGRMPFRAHRHWDRERELARQRAKYLREVATPEGIARRRRWAKETYRRAMATPEGRARLAQKAREGYHRRKGSP